MQGDGLSPLDALPHSGKGGGDDEDSGAVVLSGDDPAAAAHGDTERTAAPGSRLVRSPRGDPRLWRQLPAAELRAEARGLLRRAETSAGTDDTAPEEQDPIPVLSVTVQTVAELATCRLSPAGEDREREWAQAARSRQSCRY